MTTKDLTYGALGIGLLTIASQLSFHLGQSPLPARPSPYLSWLYCIPFACFCAYMVSIY
ncbi:hypothetical protein R0V13_04865 [Facklamia hominis]|uniref:hypothetical protein n=1 Tax=Facklamia hominis TaxID=178214 RepID=UPI0029D4118F|nr:hypothetical protein [Facklamia hominis]WPJ91683.1 hypothetical protein R0V13_04865 [Facklamia hominis]